MWSQPDIVRMNAEAKAEAPDFRETCRLGFKPIFKQRLAADQLNFEGGADPSLAVFFAAHPEYQGKPHLYSDGILTIGEDLACECEDWSTPCAGPKSHTLWFDIFSDDPKGVLTLCEAHDGYYGDPTEGYFTCAHCNRVFISNYTWEYYHTETDDGLVCLPCAAKEYISEPDNWIDLTEENIAAVDFARVREAKHVIGVDMPLPKGIKFFDNAEFDSGNGQQISGDSIQDILTRAKDEGHTKALLILDAGYQFAVSIGVYVAEPGR